MREQVSIPIGARSLNGETDENGYPPAPVAGKEATTKSANRSLVTAVPPEPTNIGIAKTAVNR